MADTAGAPPQPPAAADQKEDQPRAKKTPVRRGKKAAAAAAEGTATAAVQPGVDAKQETSTQDGTDTAAAAGTAVGAEAANGTATVKPKAKRTPKPAVPPGGTHRAAWQKAPAYMMCLLSYRRTGTVCYQHEDCTGSAVLSIPGLHGMVSVAELEMVYAAACMLCVLCVELQEWFL